MVVQRYQSLTPRSGAYRYIGVNRSLFRDEIIIGHTLLIHTGIHMARSFCFNAPYFCSHFTSPSFNELALHAL